MEFLISHEDGPELGQQPMNSGSKYDAYRRSHDAPGSNFIDIFLKLY
jgi:hypothetical protein